MFLMFMLTFSRVDEVGRDVAAIKLHAFDDLQLIMQGFAILDDPEESKISEMLTSYRLTKRGDAYLYSDHAFTAHFLHGVGDDRADFGVSVGRNSGHLWTRKEKR